MAVISADELLDQADRLVAGDDMRRPTQVDMRRGVSSAYYAAFRNADPAERRLFLFLILFPPKR